jgi:penicillin amidase
MRSALLLVSGGCLLALAAASSCKSSTSPSEAANGPFGSDVPVTDYVHLDHLAGPVDVVRDTDGMVHIYATSLADAVRVEGYQMARDRIVQLELYRRVSEGRTAELLGDVSPDLIDQDITMRTIGLFRAAKLMYAQYPDGSEAKAVLDAFADGISQWSARLQAGQEDLPHAVVGLSKSAFEPWTGADVLAIARLQTQNLAYSADEEVAGQVLADAARAAFPAASSDPLLAKRSGFLVDFFRFAPLDPTTPLDGFPNDVDHAMRLTEARRDVIPAPRDLPPSVRLPSGLAASTRGWSKATKGVLALLGSPPIRGSNNWIVSPSLSATGHALLANDPHLSLSAPSVFYMVQIDVTSGDEAADVHAAGMAFPGIPGIVLGFNQNLAWGATTADYDVTDVYHETLTSDGSAVVFKGQNVPIEKIHETIGIAGKASLEYDVLNVPHHGPIIPNIVDHAIAPPDPKAGALSVKWTGYQATDELGAFTGYLRAKDVEGARASIRKMGVGAQNFVFADTTGNIFYSTQSQIPKRDKNAFTWDAKKFEGNLPCLVLPGDGSAEWTGQYLEEAYVPHVKNPPQGFLATANGDQIGDTLDNDPSNDKLPTGEPMYLACWHDAGYRVGRIVERLKTVGHPLTIDDLSQIQADSRSNMGALLAPQLLLALSAAEEETAAPGKHPDLTAVVSSARYKAAPIAEVVDVLKRWQSESDYDAPAGVSLDDGSLSADPKEALASKATLLYNTWYVRMIELVLDDELAKVGIFDTGIELRRALGWLMTADPKSLATYDDAAKDSAIFDDLTTKDVVESRSERAVTALLDAIDFLTTKLGADRDGWRWGKLHTLRFASLVPLWGSLSIPPVGDAVFPNGFPRHGDGYNVDVGEYYDRPKTLSAVDFSYGVGPVQRLVIELDPSGPIARNVLPGGEVWDTTSKHFRDGAEEWRRNKNHPVPFAKADVAKSAEDHTVYTPGAARDVAAK